MSRVELDFPGWSQSGETWARGYAHLDGRFLDADGLAEALDACASDPDWTKVIAGLNGCFAAVSSRGSRVRAAVDRVRSIPLFYVVANGDVYLSDSAYRVMESSGVRQMDTMADIEFCLTGYVTGTATLCTGIHQIEAGEVVCLDSAATPTSERRRYFEFRHRNFCTAHVDELISELEGVHARVFTRLLESTRGRTVAVPLSGGYDSRLVGVSLRDLGLRDVICYSYGVSGNWESRISQELARYLGFRWEFVPYSADRWRTWAATDQFRQYFHAAGNLTSVPHIQDWPALFELRREARIPPGTVFVPGHSGDFVAGSHIPRSFAGRSRISRRETLDALQRAHYSLWD